MIIEHVTSLSSAINIIQTGHYKPASRNPLHGDVGLNCLNGTPNNTYAGNGVILKLNWTGQLPIMNLYLQEPYCPNKIYDEGPWRLFVPIGTSKYLTFNSLVINSNVQLEEYLVSKTNFLKKLLIRNWMRKEKRKLDIFLSESKEKPIHLL